jgi:hypothetical protein
VPLKLEGFGLLPETVIANRFEVIAAEMALHTSSWPGPVLKQGIALAIWSVAKSSADGTSPSGGSGVVPPSFRLKLLLFIHTNLKSLSLSWCPLLFLSPFSKELDSLSSSAAFASFC